MADVAAPITASSAADFAATIPADFFDAPDAGGEGAGSEAAEAIDTGDAGESSELGAPSEVTTGEEATEVQSQPDQNAAEQTETAEAEAQPAETQPPAVDLPDGVRLGKDKSGNEGVFVAKDRWEKTIYPHHKAVQEMSELIGEPLTADALRERHEAFIGSEKLYSDLFSGDPTAQRNVLDHFFEQAAERMTAGEVGSDPMVSFTSTFYQALKERNAADPSKGDPAYQDLRINGAKDLLAEMFNEAATTGDESLFYAAQNFARRLAGFGKDATDASLVRAAAERIGIPFYTKAEMAGLAKGRSPEMDLRAENAHLKAQLEGRQTTNQAAQFETWHSGVKQAVQTAVLEKGVREALSEDSQKGAWATNQTAFQRLVIDPLHKEVIEKLKSDPVLAEKVARLTAEAKRAVSAQIRDAKRAQIEAAYATRARQIAEANKKRFLTDAATTFQGQNAQRHERLSAAQNQRVPKGSGNPVPRSVAPKEAVNPGGFFDAKTEMKRVAALLSQ